MIGSNSGHNIFNASGANCDIALLKTSPVLLSLIKFWKRFCKRKQNKSTTKQNRRHLNDNYDNNNNDDDCIAKLVGT